MNLFARLATATGQSMLAGQDYAKAQADLENKQQANAMQRMQMAASRQKMETDRIVGEQIQAEFAADQSKLTDPAKAAEVYSKAARTAVTRGDFEGARSFETMAQSEVQRAQTAAANLREQQRVRSETLANAASDFRSNPTPDTAGTVIKSALASGIPMKDIPDLRDPRFTAWARRQEQAGMSAKERLLEEDKVRMRAEELEYRKRHDEEARADKLEQRRENAAFRQEGLGIRRMLALSSIQQREGKSDSGDLAGIGKTEMTHRGQAIGAGVQAVRQVEQLALGFRPGDTLGPFASMKPGADLSTGLKNLGATALTPAAAQAMQAVTANLAKNLGNLLTAIEGGRAPTDSQIKAMQVALAPAAGENVLVTAFKIKNAVEEIDAGLRGAQHRDPEKEAQRQETLTKLKSVMPGVSSLQILQTIRDSKNPKAMEQSIRAQSSYNDAASVLGIGGRPQDAGSPAPKAANAPAAASKPMSVDEWLAK